MGKINDFDEAKLSAKEIPRNEGFGTLVGGIDSNLLW